MRRVHLRSQWWVTKRLGKIGNSLRDLWDGEGDPNNMSSKSKTEWESIMEKGIVSGFATMGIATAIIVPLAFGAQGRETRAERSASTISQSTDRAEARIAILKADLRLSSDQAQHWSGLESALRDVVAKRAKSLAASHDLETGRASSNSPAAPDTSITEDEKEQGSRSERDARKVRLDDIDEMRREADAHTVPVSYTHLRAHETDSYLVCRL